MGGRRQFVAIALVLVLAAAAGFVWAAIKPRGQAADVRAQGQSLLDAIAREIRTKFIVRSINETEIYEGAGKGLLDAAGPACSRLLSTSPAPPAADGRQRIAVLVDEATQRCTTPRPDPQRLYFGAANGKLDSLGDQNTRFMDTRAFDEFKQDSQGFFFGIGISVNFRDAVTRAQAGAGRRRTGNGRHHDEMLILGIDEDTDTEEEPLLILL